MIRFLILVGYMVLMMYLQASDRLNQYINVHYRYLAILSMVIACLLAVVQLVQWTKESKETTDTCTSHVHDTHTHQSLTYSQKIIAYVLLSIPLMVGFLFPTVSLDTSIIEAKGFSFPLSQESVGDPDIETQYLKPDTSIYFDKGEYDTQMKEILAHYEKEKRIVVTDENYLEVMELIYTFPSEFIGKTITYTGFVFHSIKNDQKDVFIFRFGIIHCVADSGVFGLLAVLPENKEFSNNDWVEITGTIHSQYYLPFRRDIPAVEVAKVQTVEKPSNQYVYRSF